MNKVYCLIWSAVRQCWIVAAEKVTAKGGIPARTVGALSVAVLLACGTAHALPTDGTVAAGSATISNSSSTAMQITQTSNRAVINWNSFGIAKGEAVNITQPSAQAALLNRVIGNSSSEIYGSLTANGQVFLVNPNGVLFAKGASVNVGGLVASSLNITDDNFMNNNLKFFKDGTAGSITNQGSITAGFAALLGPQVDNSGTIITYKGSTALGAANAVTLNFDTSGLIALTLSEGAYNAQVSNSGIIEADAGRVLLTAKSADSILKSMVNNSGVIRARSVDTSSGQILLLGDMDNGTVKVGGTLDASAPNGGNGGFVETSAAHVKIADNTHVSTLSANGSTGTWLIDPQDYTIAASGGDISGATLSANLGLGNVAIQSSTGGTAGHGDINVNDAVSWGANNLTFTAARDININAVMTASGTSTLTMNTGTANGGDAGVAGGAVNFGFNPGYNGTGVRSFAGRVDFPGRSGAGFLTINGQDYTVIQTPAQLVAINGNLAGHYALGGDVNLGGLLWTPLGADQYTPFTGAFTGLGHVVWNPNIVNAADFQGLFGFNTGTLENVQISMDGMYSNVFGVNYVGSLVGANDTGGIVRNVVAMMDGAMIMGSGQSVGGLVGANSGVILNSHVVPYDVYGADISGTNSVGGLVGQNDGAIYNSSASFNTVAQYNMALGQGFGGLVGVNNGAIAGSYASGWVNPSYAEGVGGLVGMMGYGGASIADSYATGTVGHAVNSNSSVGGLVGYMSPDTSVTNSYATVAVVGQSAVGGLVGYRFNSYATVTNSYWDTQVSGQATSDGGTGKTSAELTQAATFAGWDISTTGGSSAAWRIYDGQTTPLLRSFLMPLTVTPAYDGSGATLGNIAAYTASTAYTASAAPLLGSAPTTLTLSSSAPDAYRATLGTSTFYSTQLGYDISVAPRSIATSGSAAGDIVINNPITWSSGTLAINTPGTVIATAAINGTGSSIFNLQSGTWSQINSSLPSFSAYDFRISGGSFIRALSGNGSSSSPYALADIYGVQGMGSSGMRSKYYLLANDIDASGTATWNSGSGFKPIGSASVTISNSAYTNVTVTINNSDAAFTGSLDGQNHVIDGLTISRPSETLVGLFGYTGSGARIANLGLTHANITGYSLVGTLAGYNTGNLNNIYATGAVIGDAISDGNHCSQFVGGLVGYQLGNISNSHYSGSLTGQNGWTYEYFGGLTGYLNGNISYSDADVDISGIYSGDATSSLHLYYLGGLAGSQTGNISSSHADVDINGSTGAPRIGAWYVGGLAGWFTSGSISDSYATGDIHFDVTSGIMYQDYIGGLVGYGYSTIGIADSHYSGSINGDTNIGGLIGYLGTNGTISIDNSYSEGTITSRYGYVGGLIGADYVYSAGGSITNSYSTATIVSTSRYSGGLLGYGSHISVSDSYHLGTVSGYDNVGGLAGYLTGSISNSYAEGDVTSEGSYVGGLVGQTSSTVSNSHATGNVIATGSDTDYVGGLIGYTTGAVSNSYATGNVTASSADYVGGLIGYTTANVSNTYATGDVTGYRYYVGGLVGMLEGTNLTISDSHATGAVLGSYIVNVPSLGYDVYYSVLVGGLVGQLNGDNTNITNSYATGSVTGGTMVGGLVGGSDYDGDIANHQHFISNSYATGDVTATNRVINFSESGIAGGLVGQADGLVITNSYATGNVSGRYAGGLVGWEYGGYLNDDDTATDGWGRIVNSYATGSVSGSSYYYFSCSGTCISLYSPTGGLLGFNQGSVNIINSYAVGAVSSADTTNVGGLVGDVGYIGGTISNSFWNTETTRQSSVGNYSGVTLTNVTGLTTAQMMTASNFSSAGWDISTTGGSTAVWRIYEGYTTPLLRSFLTSLTLTPSYDGSGTALINIADLTGTGSYDSSLLLGSATSTTLTLSSSSAGSYTASANAGSSGLYSTQQGYDLSYADRTITTTGSAAGNIVISNPITWSSGTLAINTSGTVTANAAVNGSGSAIFDLQSGTWRQISSSLPSFSAYDFRISGGSFIRALAGNGTSSNPYQLADIYGVQGIGSSGMLGKSYLLANDIDATGTSAWNSGAGFKPIGNYTTGFTGSFNGQSNTIDGLTINRPGTEYVGLFGANYGTLSHLALTNADVTGKFCVGVLAGYNYSDIDHVSVQGSVVATDEFAGLLTGGSNEDGTISNATASGSVSGVNYVGGLMGSNWGVLSNASASATVTGAYEVGGLAGENGGTISSSHASGNVSGSGDYVGGLVGKNEIGLLSNAGQITDVYATGTVSGVNYVGGLIGTSDANTVISNAYATGSVTGTTEVGGLVGHNEGGSISVSYATGNVTGGSGSNMLGGLVGYNNSGSISASYAIGSVSGDEFAGGLVGWNHGSINTSYATGAVTANLDVAGGLVGDNTHGSISNSYATGSVNSDTFAGGLAGANEDSATISNSYATGTVTGNSSTSVGGLAGINTADSSISNSFFNSNTSGQSSAVGGNVGTLYNVVGKTTSELKTASTFSDVGWDIGTTGGSSTVWRIYDGYTYPLLRSFLTALSVSMNGGSKTYNGTTDVSSAASYSSSYNSSLLSGTLTAATSSKNVGSYSVAASGLYSTQQGYDVSYVNGTVTITPATLTISAASNSKTYDATTSAAATPTYSGLQAGDSLTGLTETYNSKNVLGTGGSTLSVSGYTLDDGNSGNNYTVVSNSASGTITPATLTVSGAATASDKTYDGTTTATVTGGSLNGVISGDTVTLSQSGTFSDKNVGTGKTVSYGSSLAGTDSGNYVIDTSTGTAIGATTADITPAALIVTANNAVATYSGSAYSGGNGVSYSGFATGDDASVLSGSLGYSGTSQGAINVGSYTITPGGLSSGNYTIAFVDGLLTIRPVSNLSDQLVPLFNSLNPPSKTWSPSELLQLQALDDKRNGATNSLSGLNANDLIVIINGGIRR